MTRLYQNFIGGLLDANLLAADTTMSSPALAALLEVTGTDTMTAVIDPDGIGGAPEAVTITAHTAGSTTATVTRGVEGTTARDHLSGIDWVHTLTAEWATGVDARQPVIGTRTGPTTFSYTTDLAPGATATIHTIAAIVPTKRTLFLCDANGTVQGVTSTASAAGLVSWKAEIDGGGAVTIGAARWHTNGFERQMQLSLNGFIVVLPGESVVFTLTGANDAGSGQAVDHTDWYRTLTPVEFG